MTIDAMLKVYAFTSMILLNLFLWDQGMNDKSKQIMTETRFNVANPSIPFIANPNGKVIYEDHRWGIKVLDVIADGKQVPRTPCLEFLDDIDIRTKKPLGEFYIYKVNVNDLTFGELKNGDYSLWKYTIPHETDSLDVSYRIAHPDGSTSPQKYVIRATKN